MNSAPLANVNVTVGMPDNEGSSKTACDLNVNNFKNQIVGCNKYDLWALGITIVIGGQYFSWNAGLEAGFGSYGIGFFLIGTSYICLCLCTSELSSALPFAGGSYGLARCTLGFYAGFIIGCCETVEYIMYVSSSVVSLGAITSYAIPELSSYQPVIWLIFYITALSIHIFSCRIFWLFNIVIALISIIILLIYCFGSLPYVHFLHFAATKDGLWFVGGFPDFLRVLPISAWFFVGVEALSTACDDVRDPKVSIPRGQLSCVATLCVTATLVYFISSSLPTGVDDLAHTLAPLNTGAACCRTLTHDFCRLCLLYALDVIYSR